MLAQTTFTKILIASVLSVSESLCYVIVMLLFCCLSDVTSDTT